MGDCQRFRDGSNGIYERCFDGLKAPVKLVTLPDAPAPASKSLEDAYYKHADDIICAVKALI